MKPLNTALLQSVPISVGVLIIIQLISGQISTVVNVASGIASVVGGIILFF